MSDVTDAFLIAVNMSLTASAIILVVVLARLALKRAPRWCSYALWSVVLFRLLCPVSIGSAFSVLNLSRTPVVSAAGRITAVNYVESIPGLAPGDVAPAPSLAPSVTAPSGGLTPQDVGASVDWIGVLAWLWVIVAAAMLLWALVSYLSLRVRLWDSAVLEGRVRVSRRIDTAFVAGMLRPRIYLPEGLSERERECVLAHERGHIRRGDHLMKPLAYVALCLHWFNPLVWLAWVLAMRDMESSCDEAALRRLGNGARADYAQTLLDMATQRHTALAVSLSFGDDTRRRIKAVAAMRPVRRWITGIAVVLCALVIAGCAANPSASGRYGTVQDYVQERYDALPETVEYYTTAEGLQADGRWTEAATIDAEKLGEDTSLSPDGTLEVWSYGFRFRLEADPAAEPSGAQGGYEVTQMHLVYALTTDGGCEILHDREVSEVYLAALGTDGAVAEMRSWYLESTPAPASGEYATMDEYFDEVAGSTDTVEYPSASSQSMAEARVLDARVESETRGEVTGLAPEGTLEVWEYSIYYRLDVDSQDVMPVGGMLTDGDYYCFEERRVYALRHSDGSYDVLHDARYAYDSYATPAEQLYDWYVEEYNLDIPTVYTDWTDEINGGDYTLGSFPARLFAGEGWYIYVPVSLWDYSGSPDGSGLSWTFSSAYGTGSTLTVELVSGAAGEGTTEHNSAPEHSVVRRVAIDDRSHWEITAEWNSDNLDISPYAAVEPNALRQMVGSFTVADVSPAANPAVRIGQYESVEAYIDALIAGQETVEYYDAEGVLRTANVLDTQAGYSKMAEVTGLTGDGTLESWYLMISYSVDARPAEMVSPVKQMQYEPENYWHLGSSEQNFTAIRYSDGSCDILLQGEDMAQALGYSEGYVGNPDELLYDWYVATNGLDYPLCVLDWTERINEAGYEYVFFPVRRMDGNGWYLYLPIGRWGEESDSEAGVRWVYGSKYPNSNSTLTVERVESGARDETVESVDGGVHTLRRTVPIDENSHWLLTASWDEAVTNSEDTEIASDGATARMAIESFTLDSRFGR